MKTNVIGILVRNLFILLLISSNIFLYAQSVDENNIKVMTFNLRYDNQNDGLNQWSNRKKNVISMIKFYDADILGTQEVLNSQKDYLETNLPEYTCVGVGRKDGINAGEFSALFFKKNKFDIINSGTFWLSETPEVTATVGWDAALERICTWVMLQDKYTNKIFYVFNTHFDHIGEKAREKSAELILNKIKEWSGDLPVFLTGDFNFDSSSVGYKTITKKGEYKLIDSEFISKLPHHGPTWTFHGFDSVKINERKKIDYIFVNDKIFITKHGVLSDRFDGGYPSDHLPVLIEAELQ
ncbi:MAG: endonuclease/exonuclease/phosphatase family protein [Bacteroidetes bacterium]|nr:endonuclease/exonuclease/phosphatase family protein [Bacteroidota bacterium]